MPLGAAFPFLVHRPFAAAAVLLAAGLSDVLDGWWARRGGRATPTGAFLDPVMDKIFVTSVAVTLLSNRLLSLRAVLCLGARDLAELPLALWFLGGSRRRAGMREVKANALGKVATVFQFATVAAALFVERKAELMAVVTGALGLASASSYWVRAIKHDRRRAGWAVP